MKPSLRQFVRFDVLLLTTALWFLGKALRYAFPSLFEPLQSIYGVSNAELGLAFTGFMLCYAVMQFPSGVLQDRIGPTRVMVAGACVASVAALFLMVEAGFVLLVLLMLVMGAGTGLHKTVSIPLLARVYPTHTGRVLGFHDTFGAGAGVIAPILALLFLQHAGWRWFYVAAGVLGLSAAALAMTRIPRRLEGPLVDGSGSGAPVLTRYLALFRCSRFLVFAVVTALFAFSNNGVMAFLPLYLVDVVGLHVTLAGFLYSALFAAAIVQLATGELSDRFGRLSLIGGCLVLGVFGLAGLLTFETPGAIGAAVVAFGMAGHGYRPVRDAYLTEIIPEREIGGGIGLIRSLLMGMAAIAPVTVGVVADFVGFRAAFGVLIGSLGASTAALVVLVVISSRK